MISRFEGHYRFLSNFFIEPDGTHVEGEYQLAKCVRECDRDLFIGVSPAKAKQLGRKIHLQSRWDEIKLDVMHNLVAKKFGDHPELRNSLLLTYEAPLIEGNWWGDMYWGVYNGVGENQLGKILMKVRAECRLWHVPA